MASANFVHLRARSAYSLLEGAIKVEGLVDLCVRHAMPAVAITDNGNLFAALEFASCASSHGVQPIIGCLLGLAPQTGEAGANPHHPASPHQACPSLLLLAKDETGYTNLLDLVSQSFLDVSAHETPQVRLDLLSQRSDGLIALTGGVHGPLGYLLKNGQTDAAKALTDTLCSCFADRLYMEIMRHGLEDEKRTEESFFALADHFDLPLVATNDIYFADTDMYEAHDALLCIAESTVISQDDRRRLTPQHCFKTPKAMRALFSDVPEACDNSLIIAQRCSFFPENREPLLPRFSTDEDETSVLQKKAGAGLSTRLNPSGSQVSAGEQAHDASKLYQERLDYELGVITDMGYAGYFLIVADFISWAKKNAIPVGPGRGSGAGSLVAWALGITDLDPLQFGLLFERFLNPERVSMPDFDIDFCVRRRDEVIGYVREAYGRERVAQIITFGTLQARAVLRDVGRVMGLPYGQVDRVCKLVPFNPAAPLSLESAIAAEPALQKARDEDPAISRLIDMSLLLEGLPRHASTHAAGVVISECPLRELTPLYRDPRSGALITQFSMKYVEKAGLVKFDFLGLKTLTLLETAAVLVRTHTPDFDLEAIALDDPATYALLAEGHTVGVFQLESSGMRDVLRRLKPDRFEDIIAVVALYRPGPMDNIPSFINRKHGRENITYLDARVESVLSETYGIMVYQEQVMQIAQILSGYSLGKADLLRRAMGKKIQSEMDAQRQAFVDGAEQRGMNRARAEQAFDQIAKFAGYGFNKSHAAAYGLVAYRAAYMKANYPVEFLAASMTCDSHNADKLSLFRREARQCGIDVLPPDINRSHVEFRVESRPPTAESPYSQAIRYGLSGVRNVGKQAMQALVAARDEEGEFTSLGNFATRLDTKVVNKRLLESLICAGAFDDLDDNRASIFSSVDQMISLSSAKARDRQAGQESLFAGDGADTHGLDADIHVSDIMPWNNAERLKREYEALGFYLSAHPLESRTAHMEKFGLVSAASLGEQVRRQEEDVKVKIAGVVLNKRKRTSQKGSAYAAVELSDPSGVFEALVFAETLTKTDMLLEPGTLLYLEGRARGEGEGLRIVVNKAAPLDDILEDKPVSARVYWKNEHAALSTSVFDASLAQLKNLINTHMTKKGDKERRKKGGRLTLVLPVQTAKTSTSHVEISLPGHYRVSPDMITSLKDMSHIERVELH